MKEPVQHQAQVATVIGRWGDDMALLRTADGGTVEAPVPEPLRSEVDVGTSVRVTEDGSVDWQSTDEAPE
jgi:hypothetical protein